MDPNIIQPLPNDDGLRGPRYEIDEFIGDNEMTNLFLIALYNLQRDSLKVDGNNKPIWTKFYGIGGIHGSPQEAWNGISKDPRKTGSTWRGYCHHSLPTFPTWHRPYMTLLERAIYVEMLEVAESFPEPYKTSATAAAGRFRLPYWDLLMPRNIPQASAPQTAFGVPAIFLQKEVTVRWPDSASEAPWKTIHNPLYSFQYPTDQEFANAKVKRAPFNLPSNYNREETTRAPDQNGETDVKQLIRTIQAQAVNFANSFWQLLVPGPDPTRPDARGDPVDVNKHRDWNTFSNKQSNPQRVIIIDGRQYRSASIESLHDSVHGMIGQGNGNSGVMGDTAWAAFDPIFYMHHNNVDRLLSLYQALFVDQYVKNPSDLTKELQPFFQNSNGTDFVTSKDSVVADYWSPGFATPGDKAPKDTSEFAAVQKGVEKYLADTYYWATNGVKQGKSLPTWPKFDNIKASWALNPIPQEEPVVHSFMVQATALTINDGVASVVAREATIPHLELASGNTESSAGGLAPTIQDMPIETSSVISKTNEVDSKLPEGAFQSTHTDFQTTWNAYVKVRQYAFPGSFNTHVFIGKVDPNDPELYMTRDNEVGFAAVFGRNPENLEESCSNCVQQREDDIIVEDVVPLTTALYKYLAAADGSEGLIREGQYRTIADLSPESVEPFLKEQLSWRTVNLSGTEYTGQEQEAGLEVTVVSRPFMAPTQDYPMGLYGPETVYPQITSNKPGGYGYQY